MTRTRKAPSPHISQGKVSIEKDPRVYADRVRPVAAGFKRCAGLDLATTSGVTYCDFIPGKPVKDLALFTGQWDLSLGSYDTSVLRFVRLKQFLSVLNPDLIIIEDARFTGEAGSYGSRSHSALIARAVQATEVLAGLKVVVAVWAEENGVPLHGFGSGEIKKYATGKGNANKEDVIRAANARFGMTYDPETYQHTGADNICDSAFCCVMGLENYSEGL